MTLHIFAGSQKIASQTLGSIADVLKPIAGTLWGIPFNQLPPLAAAALLLALLIVHLLSLRGLKGRGNPVSVPLSLRAPHCGAWQSCVVFTLVLLLIVPTPTYAGDTGTIPIPANDAMYLVYYHSDHLGSSNFITEGKAKGKHGGITYLKGQVIQRFEYAAFGRESFALNPNLQFDPAYTGQRYDIETGRKLPRQADSLKVEFSACVS